MSRNHHSYLGYAIIYALVITFTLSIFSGVFGRREVLFKAGRRKVTQSQLLKSIDIKNNQTIDKDKANSVLIDLMIHAMWCNYFDKNRISIPEDAIYTYAKSVYKTPDSLNDKSTRLGVTKNHMLIKTTNDFFYTLIIDPIVNHLVFTEDTLNRMVENVFSRKKAYYKYIHNTEYFDIQRLNETLSEVKKGLSDIKSLSNILTDFQDAGYVSYASHFQGDSDPTNICLSSKYFKKPDNITREVAASILLTPVGQAKIYHTQGEYNIVVYVDHAKVELPNSIVIKKLRYKLERMYKRYVTNIIFDGISKCI